VGPKAGLDDVETRKFLTLLGLELRPSVVQPVAITTTLSRLLFMTQIYFLHLPSPMCLTLRHFSGVVSVIVSGLLYSLIRRSLRL
jgi:hypothetical protein